MALIILGESNCSICNKILLDEVNLVSWQAFLDEDHKLWKFSGSGMHKSCFDEWEHKIEFENLYKFRPTIDFNDSYLKEEIKKHGMPKWLKETKDYRESLENNKPLKTINQIRADFPILSSEVNGKPLVYLDNGATTQKPQQVIDCITKFYEKENSNIHRGVHTLSQESTDAYEKARVKIQQFVNARYSHEIIFTSGTTGGINMIASSISKSLNSGDEILITAMEHHSNIVPWQMICEESGVKLKVIPINEKGELLIDEYKKLISSNTKLVAFTHTSNTLGTINPVKEIIEIAKQHNALTLIDAAQAVAHESLDVQELDCDFLVFSGHKLFGPTGTGILFGKEEILNALPPYQGGGDMIKTVTFEKTTYNELPHKFEAGTPNIAGGIGLGVAIDYVNSVGFEFIKKKEKELLNDATQKLLKIEGLQLIGEAENKTSVISFVIDGIHPFDIGTIIDKMGVAVRTGHHCTQPLMDFFGIPGTTRASFSFYNTLEEVDLLIKALNRALGMLR